MLRTPQITRRKRAEEQRTNVVEKPAERLKLRSGERKVGLWIAVLFVLGVAGLSLRMPWRTSPPLARSGVSPSPLAPDGRPTLDADAPFAVRSLPGRGKGAIATRDIARGELLIREQPLFRVPNSITISPTVLLHSLLSELTPLDRAAFYNLSFVNMPSHLAPGSKEYEEYLPLAIFQTNAVAAGENMAGIFPRMARLNHGCSYAFNAVYSWRENEGVLVVHALKSIKSGEEILTTYTDTKRVRTERRQTLRDQYAFECQCACCSLPLGQSQRSDARLTFMSELYRAFATWSNGEISARNAVDIARKIWHIGEEEGYVSERGRLAGDAAYIAAAVEDEAAVRQWAELGELWAGYELGNSSELAKEMRGYTAHPRTHPMWGSAKQKETVNGPADI